MKLFKIYCQGDLGYDCNHGFVIRAKDEQSARELAQSYISDEKFDAKDFWLNPNYSSCIEVSKNGVEEIVLIDYVAG